MILESGINLEDNITCNLHKLNSMVLLDKLVEADNTLELLNKKMLELIKINEYYWKEIQIQSQTKQEKERSMKKKNIGVLKRKNLKRRSSI